jgi:hypothetical protein
MTDRFSKFAAFCPDDGDTMFIRNNPDDHSLNLHHRGNLKSCIERNVFKRNTSKTFYTYCTSNIRPQGLLRLLTFGLAIFFWVVHDFLFPEVSRPSFVWEFYFRSCVEHGFSSSVSVLTVSCKLSACTSFLIYHF